jgi:gamma-tubulin complex component 4
VHWQLNDGLIIPLQSLRILFDSFYEQLSLSTSQQPFIATGDVSKSILMNATMANHTIFQRTFVRGKGFEGDGEVRRHVERLLLRLDFNGSFSTPRATHRDREDILGEGIDLNQGVRGLY